MGTILQYLSPHGKRIICGAAIKFSAALQELILPLLLQETGVQMAQSVADALTLLCAIPIHLQVLKSLPKTDG